MKWKNILIFFGIWFFVGIALRMVFVEIDADRAKARFPMREQCTRFEDALQVYKENYGNYPPITNGLGGLLNENDLKNILVNTNLEDQWGTPFRYRIIDGHSRVDSAGPDKKFDTSDDINSFH